MNLFVEKLAHGAALSEEDRAALARLAEPGRRVERGDIQPEGAEPRSIALILDGWAYRYKQLENGKRQITSIFIPGDLCEPFGAVPGLIDFTLGAFTPVFLARVAPSAIRGLAQASPRIEQALWWDLLVADALTREHLVSLGKRSAIERLGHLLCELHLRLGLVGLTDESSYDLPLTQSDLGDLLGLSTVHVNRSLQELRRGDLLTFRGRRITIRDLGGLRELSMFSPTYLLLSNKKVIT